MAASRRRANDYLTPEEDAALQEAAINAQERIVVSLLRWTGLRVGEACARVRSAKTDSGVRSVTLLDELRPELSAWRRNLEQCGLYSPAGPVLAEKPAHGDEAAVRLADREARRRARRRPLAPGSARRVRLEPLGRHAAHAQEDVRD